MSDHPDKQAVEAIARGLSEAMCHILFAIQPDDGVSNNHIHWRTLGALRRRRLCEGRAFGDSYREHLTPLGLAVREYLKREIRRAEHDAG